MHSETSSGECFLFIIVFLGLGGEGKEGLSCKPFIHSFMHSFSQLIFVEGLCSQNQLSQNVGGYSDEQKRTASCPQEALRLLEKIDIRQLKGWVIK